MRLINKKSKAWLTVPLLLILMTCRDSLKTAEYSVRTDKISQNGVRIAFLSDLHDTFYGDVLINGIKKAAPDLILPGGDIYDDIGNNRHTRELLPQLPVIAPVYYVSGNHEHSRACSTAPNS